MDATVVLAPGGLAESVTLNGRAVAPAAAAVIVAASAAQTGTFLAEITITVGTGGIAADEGNIEVQRGVVTFITPATRIGTQTIKTLVRLDAQAVRAIVTANATAAVVYVINIVLTRIHQP